MVVVTPSVPQFPPLSDKTHFPLLAAGADVPCQDLMGCEKLTFFAPAKPAEAAAVVIRNAVDWHLYGDTRWPSLSSWIEIDSSPVGYSGHIGILVVTFEVPEDEADPFAWAAENGPLPHLFPNERSEASIAQRLGMLRQQAASTEVMAGPSDLNPRFVQAYCIYHESPTQLLARYVDLLNSEGIPIPRYRTASVHSSDVPLCRFALHALFRLNEARLAGMDFLEIPQLELIEPIFLNEGESNPPWARFHPSRVLRTRPAVRAFPSPTKLVHGVMSMETAQQVMEARRQEINLHMLAFEVEARHGVVLSQDSDACLGAIVHRANGGAIYVLPDRLVEEFNHTECDEMRMRDIKLPFSNLFLKFTPPQPLFLAEGAAVDGCYIYKQGDTYLFQLTSRLEGVNYDRSLSVACLDPTFSLHLPAPELNLDKPNQNLDLAVNEAVELGIQEFLEINAPPPDDFSRTITRPDGTSGYLKDIRAESRRRRIEIFRSQEPVFRSCLNIIVNAACFISFFPDDISEEWDGNPPSWIIEAINDTRDNRSARDRKQNALREMARGDYTRIKVCGKNLFANLPDPASITSINGQSPRAHWRRGHWRRQRHGPGLSLATPRWIRPTIVMPDNGPMVESRIYDIQQPPNSGTPTNLPRSS